MRRFAWIAGLVLALALAGAAQAQEAAGDWLGTLEVNGAKLHLALHIQKAASGYGGSLDSLDQGAAGIALASVVVGDGTLSFQVPSVGGAFEGKWDAAQNGFVGEWRQGAHLPLVLTRGRAASAPVVNGLDGTWEGVLATAGGTKLRLAVRVRTGTLGTTASLDSPDQLAMGIPVSAISRTGGKVRFELGSVGGVFEGDLSADGATLAGTWRQGASALPLTLTRRPAGAPEARLERPQTPKPPFPYRIEDVTFDSLAAHARLAGTLTTPPGKGPFAAAVLIAGSGPQLRDEEVLGHKVFAVLADRLTRAGIAILRYDKRGVGASGGDYAHATSPDFAADALAAVDFLRGRQDIDGRRIGLVGHSEGGLVAPMVAVRDGRIAFMVLLAAPGVDGQQILDLQRALIARAGGASDAAIAKARALNDQVFTAVRTAKDNAEAQAKAREIMAKDASLVGLPTTAIDSQASVIASDWFRFFLAYDPAPTLTQVRCPVLALWGDKDLQVPPAEDVPPVRAALAGDADVTIKVLPSLNHLFQTAKTGSPAEYAEISETFSPATLDLITSWIGTRISPPPGGGQRS